MRDITIQWGMRQAYMQTIGSLADDGAVRLVADVSPLGETALSRVYDVAIRRADASVYQAASGLTAASVGEGLSAVSYVFTAQDLSVPGALWITLRGEAGDGSWIQWTFLGWVAGAAYDGGYGVFSPLWAEGLMAMLYASNGANTGLPDGGDGGTAYAPMVIPLTVAAGDWSGGAYTFNSAVITANRTGYLAMSAGASASLYNQYAAARPYVSAQTNGSITVSLLGVTPLDSLNLELVLL